MSERDGVARAATVSGSRRRDLALLAACALAIALGSARLPVYHSLRVVQVDVARVTAGGARQPLPTPPRFRRPGSELDAIERRISDFMQREAPPEWRAPGARIEWRLRWSQDSLRLDQSRALRFEAGAP